MSEFGYALAVVLTGLGVVFWMLAVVASQGG